MPTAVLLRPPPVQGALGGQTDAPPADRTVRRAVTLPQFAVLVVSNFLCCATHSVPIFHTVR